MLMVRHGGQLRGVVSQSSSNVRDTTRLVETELMACITNANWLCMTKSCGMIVGSRNYFKFRRTHPDKNLACMTTVTQASP